MRKRAAVLVLAVATACAGGRAADWNQKGCDSADARDWTAAASSFGEAVKADGSVAKYHTNLATAMAHLGRTQYAMDEYRAALRLDPTDGAASRGLEVVSRAVSASQAQQQADFIADGIRH